MQSKRADPVGMESDLDCKRADVQEVRNHLLEVTSMVVTPCRGTETRRGTLGRMR
jgi:hypothetical protein